MEEDRKKLLRAAAGVVGGILVIVVLLIAVGVPVVRILGLDPDKWYVTKLSTI